MKSAMFLAFTESETVFFFQQYHIILGKATIDEKCKSIARVSNR